MNKTTEIKPSSSASNQIQAKRQPFFNKDGAGSFFSKSDNTTRSFFSPTTIQPKLTIGQPNDKYEVEADNMADKVVQNLSGSSNEKSSSNIANHGIQRKCTNCEKEETLQKKRDLTQRSTALQLKPIFESNIERPEGNV